MNTEPLVKEATKRDYLIQEKNGLLQSIVTLEIDIEVLTHMDGEAVVAKQRITENSFKDVTAQVMLSKKKKELAGALDRLNVIEQMLKAL